MSAEIVNPPDVSVVLPVWGDYVRDGLGEALDSLRRQDLDARIIVVDNASEPALEELPGVEVLRSSTRVSVGAARNLGLSRVESPYVVFWDADDVMLPGTLRFLRDEIAAHPEAVLVATSIVEGQPPVPHRWPRRWTYGLTRWARLFAFGHCVWSLFPSVGGAIMRTDAARAHGYADTNIGEDWVLGVSLVFRGRIRLESRPGRLYRRHAESLWESQRSPRQLLRNAGNVRDRIRSDEAAPPWLRALLPVIASLQAFVALVLHPLAETVRAIRTPRSSVG